MRMGERNFELEEFEKFMQRKWAFRWTEIMTRRLG